MPTLVATDIAKIQELYHKLDRLHAQRGQIKEVKMYGVRVEVRKGTSGVDFYDFADLSAEAGNEIRDILARDIRRRSAKVVEALHKYGCEAKLTEE